MRSRREGLWNEPLRNLKSLQTMLASQLQDGATVWSPGISCNAKLTNSTRNLRAEISNNFRLGASREYFKMVSFFSFKYHCAYTEDLVTCARGSRERRLLQGSMAEGLTPVNALSSSVYPWEGWCWPETSLKYSAFESILLWKYFSFAKSV